MKSKLSRVLLVAALAIVTILCWNVYAQEKQSSKVVWEYNVVSFVGDNTYQLSQLGAQGWELTSVRSEEEMVGNFRQTKVYYYLKRAK
jgi:lipopolysaccharide export system protein LptC